MNRELLVMPLEVETLGLTKIVDHLSRIFAEDYPSIKFIPGPRELPQSFTTEKGLSSYCVKDGLGVQNIFDFLCPLSFSDVLAITEKPLIKRGEEGLLYSLGGICDVNLRKSVVSSFNIDKYKFTAEQRTQHLSMICMHEVGHLNGLDHHLREIGEKKYCPMASPEQIRTALELSRRDSKIYDAAGLEFCEPCRNRNFVF